MKRVLVVEDMPIFRDPIAVTLKSSGYKVNTASNGEEAINSLNFNAADIILLDIGMPKMDGLTFLRHLRGHRASKVPVVLLTAVADRDAVVEASKLGISGYILKSNFSLAELLKIVQAHAPETSTTSPEATKPEELTTSRRLLTTTGPTLARGQILQRLKNATEAKVFKGTVRDILALSSIEGSDIEKLATVINRDPIMASRILNLANSTAFAPLKTMPVTSTQEAVQRIGAKRVGQIAAQVVVMDAFSSNSSLDVQIIRCWQHSFAVAYLMDTLSEELDIEQRNISHFIGLCHNLGEIILRQEIPEEYSQVQESNQYPNEPLHVLEKKILGLTSQEVTAMVVENLSLPEGLTRPLLEYLAWEQTRGPLTSKLSRLLELANSIACAFLITPNLRVNLRPFSNPGIADLIGDKAFNFNANDLHSLVRETTIALADRRLPKDSTLFSNICERTNKRFLYLKPKTLAKIDCIELALASLGELTIANSLPVDAKELNNYAALVIVNPRGEVADFPQNELLKLLQTVPDLKLQVLFSPDQSIRPELANRQGFQASNLPITLARLNQLLQ